LPNPVVGLADNVASGIYRLRYRPLVLISDASQIARFGSIGRPQRWPRTVDRVTAAADDVARSIDGKREASAAAKGSEIPSHKRNDDNRRRAPVVEPLGSR
jgi:hypothetical protein